jgi:Holliday junction DNA helicase RuvA
MLVELKDKAVVAQAAEGRRDGRPAAADLVSGESLSALINLGYRRDVAARAVDAAREELGAEASFEALFKRALKGLVR